jgi:hypothetical protein
MEFRPPVQSAQSAREPEKHSPVDESRDARASVTSRSLGKRFILICGYFVFLACLFEGFARLAFSIPQVAKRLTGNEDYTFRRNWVQSHQQYGLEAYYTFDMYDPSKGWMPKPNVKDLKVFDNKILNTNSKSLRGKREFSYGRDGRLRILILGDSFTFGDEVSDDETYSSYLQEMLPNAEVINMGVHGYGHDQMLILLKEEGIKYAPDIVIVGFLPLDMSRNLLIFRDYAKPRFLLRGGELKLTGTPVPRPEEVLKWDWARPRIVDLFTLVRHQIKRGLGIQEQEMRTITTAILTDMIRTIESIPAIPILAYLPHQMPRCSSSSVSRVTNSWLSSASTTRPWASR